MDKAKISQIATPAEIVENPANDYVRHFVVDNLMAKIDSLRAVLRN
jgi:ABC-type proline/glycine betaine transport system ATPase subunit